MLLTLLTVFTLSFLAPDLTSWRDIVPLATQKKDIEKHFGPPVDDKSGYPYYAISEGRLRVEYSVGACETNSKSKSKFNVPDDTVLAFSLSFKDSDLPEINSLGIDLAGFKKFKGPHPNSPVFFYEDRKSGILITSNTMSGTERVQKIEYSPSSENAKKFACIKNVRSLLQ